MKKTFVTLFVMLSMLWSMGASAQTLVFHLIDGTTADVELSSTFRMSTVGSKTIVSLPDGSTKEFSQNDILTVTYREKRGDVNRDNMVDVADIATVISIMAGEQEPVKTISVTTGSVTNITYNSAVVEGTIKNADSPANVGILYGTSSALSINSDKKATATSMGDFTITLSSLSGGTTYYYCAFAEVDGKYYYGETKNFRTENPPVSITVTTYDASDVAETSATLNGSISVKNTTKNYIASFFLSTSGTPSSSNYMKKVEADSNKTANYTASVTGLSGSTTYRFRAYVFYDGEYYYGETKTFTTTKATTGVLNGHEWVDLGLPSGTKWAACNVGASSPTDKGNYYAWGEMTEKRTYELSNWEFKNIPDPYDGKGYYAYDIAYINWGKAWHMPTWDDFYELTERCYWKWITDGIQGYQIIGPNGNSIFLPATGIIKGTGYSTNTSIYWTSQIGGSNYKYPFPRALSFSATEYDVIWDYKYGYEGCSIRPVTNY